MTRLTRRNQDKRMMDMKLPSASTDVTSSHATRTTPMSASPAHPTTHGIIDGNDLGVGESGAVHYQSAPSEMGEQGRGVWNGVGGWRDDEKE